MKDYAEIVKDGRITAVVNMGFAYRGILRLPGCGICSVVWGENEGGYEHVSVSPKSKKLPTWNDMCTLKDIFFYEEEEAYQIHPKKSEYVNLSTNCLHLWKPKGRELRELVR